MSIKLDKYPIINTMFYEEHIQPKYSRFIAKMDNLIYNVNLNESAAFIFNLCDGQNSIKDIVITISKFYNEDFNTAENYIINFIKQAVNANHIILLDSPKDSVSLLTRYGSKEYWTPEMISIELTHSCPLKCAHCFLNAGNGEFINDDLMKRIISEISILGTKQIQLTGGEPLLHPHFFDYFSELYRQDREIQIFTSGYILNDSIKEQLYKFKNKKNILFQISVDGLEAFHDEFRGIKGSFAQAMKFLEYLKEINISSIVATCISDQSYTEISGLCKIIKEKGVKILRIGAISNQGRAKENNINSSSNDIISIRTLIQNLNQEFSDQNFKVVFNEDNIIETKEKPVLNNCGMGQIIMKIGPDGYVYPCLMSTMKIGDLNSETIIDIQSKHSKKFELIKSPRNEICGNCNSSEVCKTCIAQGIENSSEAEICRWLDKYKQILKDIK